MVLVVFDTIQWGHSRKNYETFGVMEEKWIIKVNGRFLEEVVT